MACVVVAQIRLKSAEALMEYAKSAMPIIASHGGTLEFHGRKAEVVCGRGDADLVTVLRFPDVEHAKAWYFSPEYQRLLPTRDRGADEDIVFYEENPVPPPAGS